MAGPASHEVEAFIRSIYVAFNARDIDTVLAGLHLDVDWPNGMEGGYVRGHEAVRDYWTRQWEVIDPNVQAEAVALEDDGRIAVRVHQVVRDRAGATLNERVLDHVYTLSDGVITRMELRPLA